MNVQVRRIDPRVVPAWDDARRPDPEDPNDPAWAIEEIAPPQPEPSSRPLHGRDWRLYAAVGLAASIVGAGAVGRLSAGGTLAQPPAQPAVAAGTSVPAVQGGSAPAARGGSAPAVQGRSAPAADPGTAAMPLTVTVRVEGAVGDRVAPGGTMTQASVTRPADSLPTLTTVGFIDRRFVEPGTGDTVLSAWMETDSASTACLATLNEAGGGDLPGGPVMLFCAARSMVVGGTLRTGLWLHLFLPGPMGTGHYDVNAYQQGATFYGEAMLWVPPES